MKRYLTTTFLLVLTGFFLVGCAGQTIKKTAPAFTPYQFNANQYVPKVNNFVVIMDSSYSMNDKYGAKTKGEISKKFLMALNQTIPELGYHAELITYDKIEYGSTRYSTGGFGKALRETAEPKGNSCMPLVRAINTANKELKTTSGKTAVIIVSDGERLDQRPAHAAAILKKQLGGRLCIYTVLIGDNPAGAKALQQIVGAGTCGSASTSKSLTSAGQMKAFVEGILLTPKPAPKPAPKPVVMPLDSDGDGVNNKLDQCPNTPKGATVDARGCWTYRARFLFDFDSTKIKPEAFPMLDEAVTILKINADMKVEIDGYTDNIGSADYNLNLSERRAKAAMNYFIGHGVDAKQLSARGFGMTQPVVGNDTREGRAKNRRVELRPVK